MIYCTIQHTDASDKGHRNRQHQRRIAQKAMNNITKHARASRVHIVLDSQPQGTELVIKDNGRGFRRDEIVPGHFGLLNMQERAEKIGAELIIDSVAEQGTRIALVWPVSEGR
jgi:two-component system sensor histidine kinase DegS